MGKNDKYSNILAKVFVWIMLIVIFLSINGIHIRYKELDYEKELSIKVGQTLPSINDYLDDSNLKKIDSSKIEWENLETIGDKIYTAGEYNGYIYYGNEKITLKLNVIDDEGPSIDGVKDIMIYVNDNVDLLKSIKVTDNSNDEIDIQLKGEYDLKKKGEYNLSYVATDKSNNQTVKEFKLTVKEKEVIKPSENINESVVVGTTSKGYTITKINGVYYINDILIANKTYGLPSNYTPGGLMSSFNNAFNTMKGEAAKGGITLNVISGYRSYSRQKTLYNNYVSRDGKTKADTYSARAGHSEHQSGLAADINSLYTSFIDTKEGKWLNDNCYKYGFIIRYPKGKESITGYMYEPWHIRYVGVEVATALYNNGDWISLEEYLGITSQYNY